MDVVSGKVQTLPIRNHPVPSLLDSVAAHRTNTSDTSKLTKSSSFGSPFGYISKSVIEAKTSHCASKEFLSADIVGVDDFVAFVLPPAPPPNPPPPLDFFFFFAFLADNCEGDVTYETEHGVRCMNEKEDELMNAKAKLF